jgi:hypothetical protein
VQRITTPRQDGLFGNEGPHPADDDFETPVYYPDPDKVREELHRILGEARAARTIPWDANRTALYRTIFPQMTGCLPEDEGAQLRFDFRNRNGPAGSSIILRSRDTTSERASVCRSPPVIRSGKVKPSWGFNLSRLLEQERSRLDSATKSHFAE